MSITRTSVILPLVTFLAACGTEPTCQRSAEPQAAAAFCAPASIASGQPLRLQVREQCGGCQRSADRCEVVLQGQEIKLRLLGETCTLPLGAACPAACSVNVFDCQVPALAPGTYRVSAEAGTAMVVMMSADPSVSATACTAP